MATRPGYIWSGTEWVSIGQEAIATPFKYQATEPTSPSTGDIWVDSDAVVSGVNTNDFLLKADVLTTAVYKMNTGSTTERPTGAAGLFRFNTTTGYPEWYDVSSSTWLNFYQQKSFPIEYLVLGGGGGGSGGIGGQFSGAGGAGGLCLTGTLSLSPGISFSVSVGAGGAGSSSAGSNGNSSILSTVTAAPGNGAATVRNGADNPLYIGGRATTGVNGMAGAGAGGNGNGTTGGIGVSSSITGTSVGRGGGASGTSGTATDGGGLGVNGAGTSGATNKGGGGGGGYNNNSNGSGGSGIVIIAYPDIYSDLTSISAGLTYTLSTSSRSGYKVYSFTSGTGTVIA